MHVKTILVLAANPTSTSRLRLDEEIREIDEGLRRANKRELFKLEQKWAINTRDFYRAILDYQPQFIHFCGHGAGEDGLVLDSEMGQAIFMEAETLSSMFELFATKGVECVLLNACYSKVQAEAISKHINYVIGMNRTIGDRAAINFAVAFYDSLAAGEDIEFAFKLGCSQLIGFKEHETPVLMKKPSITSPESITNRLAPRPIAKVNLEDDFCYDAYISYVDKEPDATWVWDTLLPRLEQAGLRIAVSGDVDIPGVAHVENIESGITQSKRTIVVISETYLADNMAEFENVLVQTMGIQEGSYRLLPLKMAPIDLSILPKRLSMLTMLDLTHPRRAEREFERLVSALQKPLPRR